MVSASNETDVLAADNSIEDIQSVSEDISVEGVSDDSDAVAVSDEDIIADEIPTSNQDSSRKDTHFEYEKQFSRVATDYYAGERGGMFYAYLKDSDGKPLANKNVQIAVNGPIYNVTTGSDGGAGLVVNLMNENVYTYALTFSGDDDYNAAPLASTKLTVTKKPITISAAAKSFKASAKTKTYSVTLKTSKNPYDGKTYIGSKSVKLTINGKTYSAKCNSKGVVKFSIKITKKGKYTAKISFAGDNTYNSASKSVKITIK